MFAVKKGSVAEGSSGKTSIFCGGTGTDCGSSPAGVNLKRAICLMTAEVSVLHVSLKHTQANEGKVG